MSLIQANHIPGLTKWYNEGGKGGAGDHPRSCADGGGRLRPALPQSQAHLRHRPELRRPRQGHRQRRAHGFPGSFFKMADTLVGYGDDIPLPKLKEAQKTTAEAELGIIMGRDCRDVPEEEWGERHRRLHHDPRHDRGIHPQGQRLRARQSPLPDHRQELPDVLLLRSPARHARRGARRPSSSRSRTSTTARSTRRTPSIT